MIALTQAGVNVDDRVDHLEDAKQDDRYDYGVFYFGYVRGLAAYWLSKTALKEIRSGKRLLRLAALQGLSEETQQRLHWPKPMPLNDDFEVKVVEGSSPKKRSRPEAEAAQGVKRAKPAPEDDDSLNNIDDLSLTPPVDKAATEEVDLTAYDDLSPATSSRPRLR